MLRPPASTSKVVRATYVARFEDLRLVKARRTILARVPDAPSPHIDYARRHLRAGWSALLIFATLGLVLESLHGFKVRAYLDVSNETRRLMWTLSHAHGTAMGVINILFGLTVRALPDMAPPRLASRLMLGATLLLPAGFFLGGVGFFAGDPGVGVVVLPVGAALLLSALYLATRVMPSHGADPVRRVTTDDRRSKR
jgi:hypothetical protein